MERNEIEWMGESGIASSFVAQRFCFAMCDLAELVFGEKLRNQ
jgi:hypothetical protein